MVKMKNVNIIIALLAVSVLLVAGMALLPDSTNLSKPEFASNIEFKTSTVAICEYNEDSVYCHDELLVNCGDEEYILPKSSNKINCNCIELGVPSITAFAVFDKDWKDPRSLA